MKELMNLNSPIIKILGRTTDLFLLNILFLVTSIPIITIGASLVSLNTSWQKILKDNDEGIVRSYFTCFKKNFVQATISWLVILLMTVLFLIDFYLFEQQTAQIRAIGLGVLFPFVLALLLLFLLLFSYLGRYEDTIARSVKNCFLIAVQNGKQILFLLSFNIAVIYFSLSSPERLLTSIYFYTFGGFSVISLINNLTFRKIYLKVEKNFFQLQG
ncbi:hypothetical protein A5886_000344 [Enterococcus sp. 8G7_MSG3316]|uniref:DUF624 domain-containing protein n=1 Tax=Candidatus Enterococcus testudinis TaxID=1834191 RepID=A0A242A2M0_9ENTE|nr:YesL family protein [Enterococcus sp. 8G7_MSG3316]OTN75274.1 hypothetical protein A5886_000344 [Enterococcus sp. 8G7_MSG3316]